MNQHPAANWIDKNWEWLAKEFNNQWIGATAEGEVLRGDTFDAVLEYVRGSNIPVEEIVFVFLTEDSIQ